MNKLENIWSETQMYLSKWYDEGLIGRWNVRNSEGKGGWKYDISES